MYNYSVFLGFFECVQEREREIHILSLSLSNFVSRSFSFTPCHTNLHKSVMLNDKILPDRKSTAVCQLLLWQSASQWHTKRQLRPVKAQHAYPYYSGGCLM